MDNRNKNGVLPGHIDNKRKEIVKDEKVLEPNKYQVYMILIMLSMLTIMH
ncbi:MAG: hypothetical protein KatS3mg003_0379 [Candidatus Nitrosocaldaceae archaeon]|nr:MAG: hypothetical protein KatS3mg003_0379 [Candidatus Nitrosocaldaceae archaeon]